jgi:uncharacterized membrane protein
MSSFHVIAGAGDIPARPIIRKIQFSDLSAALEQGMGDFWAMPSHAVFLSILYPTVGIFLVVLTSGQDVMPLLYPLMSGFALIGPLAAIGLYEISRQRELGHEPTWQQAFDVLRSSAVPSIFALGFLLMMIFIAWIATAEGLYHWLFRPSASQPYLEFLTQVFTTREGLTLLFVGNFIGLLFTIVAFSLSVVSFPLLLDRDVGAAVAIQTSVKAVLANPQMMAIWGLIVAVLLALGTATVFIGLAIAMPVLGHSTWHLYRRLVAFEDDPVRR